MNASRTDLHRFSRTPFCRMMAKILVALMVFQTFPLWELSRSHQWSPEVFAGTVHGMMQFFGPVEAQAAPPVADAGGDRSLVKNRPSGSSVLLDGLASFDPNGDPLTYEWYGPFMTTSGATPAVIIPEGTYSVSLAVDDGTSRSPVDTATLSITPCFSLTARAKSGKVQLVWTHQPGTEHYDVFRAAEAAPLTFQKMGETTSTYSTYLDPMVTNETTYVYVVAAVSAGATCYSGFTSAHPTASRTASNYAPVITSSPITVATVGISYNYQIVATDPNGDALNFALISAPSGMIIDPADGLISWVPLEKGPFAVVAKVDDGRGQEITQTFTVTVVEATTPNRAPIANAGPDQTVFVGNPVTLDGSKSTDADGDKLTYSWVIFSFPAGSTAALSDPAAMKPTFLVDKPGTYVARLVVNDGKVDSTPDEVVVSTENSKPFAEAGPDQTALIGQTVNLDGSKSSDVDGDPLTLAWTLTAVPAGSTAQLSDPAAVKPSFSIDKPGTYVVQLIVNDGKVDSDADTVTILTENSKPVADAGPDQTAYVGDAVTLDGSKSSDVDGNPLTFKWALIGQPAGSLAQFSSPAAVKPDLTIDKPGTYVAQLIVNDGQVDSDADTVTVITENSKPVADAGLDQTAHVGDTVTLDGSKSSDVDGNLLTHKWSLTIVPAGSGAQLSDPAAVKPQFSIDKPGTYVAQLIVNDGQLDSDPDTVTVITENSKPVADAGPAQTVHVGDTVSLDGSGSSDVDGDPLTFKWSLTAVPTGSAAALSDPAAEKPSFFVDKPGTYVAQLIVNDGAVDSAAATVTISTINSKPVGEAGPDQTVYLHETVTLDGSGSSDADFDPLTYLWSFTTRPAGSSAALSSITAPQPSFDADREGTYVAQLIVNDGKESSTPDTVTITANVRMVTVPGVVGMTQADAQAAIVAAKLTVGAVTTANSSTVPAGSVISQNPAGGSSTAEGSPVALVISLGPVMVNVPNLVGMTQANAQATIVSANLVVGAITTANSSTVPAGSVISQNPTGGSTAAEGSPVNLVVSSGPVQDTSPPVVVVKANPPTVEKGANVTLTVQATDNVGVTSLALTINGAAVPLDGNGNGFFSSVLAGTFLAMAAASDAAGNTFSDSVEILVIDPSLGSIPTAAITSPAEDATLSAPIDVTGTASGNDFLAYKLAYAQQGTDQFVEFAAGTSPVTNNVLGSFDPTALPNGIYTIRLTALSLAGNQAVASRVLQVAGTRKVGLFTISFRDKVIPIGNFPLTVSRSYDSRDKTQGDFGIGWKLKLADAKLEEKAIIGADWQQSASGGWFPTYSVMPTKSHTVTITFGDEKKLEFQPQPNPQSQQLYPIDYLNGMDYLPVGDTKGTLTPDIQPAFVYPGTTGPVEIWDFDLFVYNPGAYTYKDLDGFEYRFERASQSDLRYNLTRITNPSGISTILSPTGILRSDGKSLGFTRDSQGRIIRIEDPNGNTLRYEYNIRGDLAAFIDGEGNRTEFTYDGDHNLLQIIDPLGRPSQRQEYDADGRLIAITNGLGDRIQIEHDLDAKKEIVHDRRGNPTIYEYDAQGNVIRQTEFPSVNGTPQAALTTRAYDVKKRLTSETKPNGSTTTYTYSAAGKIVTKVVTAGAVSLTTNFTYSGEHLLSTRDPRGNTSSSTYNAAGYVTSQTDREGKTTAFQVDANGQVTRETDPLGNYTVFTYDAFGNKTQEERFASTGPSLSKMTFSYDANGNKLSETTYVIVGGATTAVTTTFEYDRNDRLIGEIDALGNAHRYEYNAIGLKVAEIDKLGHRTEFVYDTRGNVTRINHPDGTTTLYGYDADNNRISGTDRNGNTTTFAFDIHGRMIRISLPDGSFREKLYDVEGNVIAEIDELGNRTDHEYDGFGRRSRTLQPEAFDAASGLNIRPETRYEYDGNSNRTAVVDANGNRTEYTRDKENRLIKTRFADGRESTITRDAVGQETAKTDPSGLTTQFTYDGLGRLLKVALPPPQTGDPNPETVYQYGETGKLKAQTDANGHTTTYEYDLAGRRTATVLPGGQRETFEYDAAGNLTGRTDFNGNRTSMTYNEAGRQILTEYPDGSSLANAYLGEGQRTRVTDSRGDTTYAYDSRNRLEQVTDPAGHVTSYLYDPAGNTSAVTTPGGTTVNAYDAINRLAQVTGSDGKITTYSYDAVGNRVGINHANQTRTVHTYNARNQLIDLNHLKNDGSTLASFNYVLNANGLRTSCTESDGSLVTYTYDGNYRLVREVRTRTHPYDIHYSYDAVGNRTAMDRDGVVTAYTYDVNDRLQSAGTVSYGYDANGNMIQKTDPSGITTYAYDYENHLTRSVAPSGRLTEYGYDGDGNRVKKQDAAGVTQYIIDTRSITGVPQVVEERDGADSLEAQYTYGHDLIAQDRGGLRSTFHFDGTGSTRALTSDSDVLTDSYTYDAYGKEIASSGSSPNSYLFAGQQYDPNIGLYYLRARYYNPETGRFVSMDPQRGDPQSPISLHRYLYANNNPVNFVDPTGKFTLIEISITISINSSLQSIYTKNLLTFFFKAVQIAYCTIQPAYRLREVAMDMIIRDVPGGEALYNLSNRMIAEGFNAIGTAILDAYKGMANDIFSVKTEVSGLLVDLYKALTTGEITVPVPEEVQQLLDLKKEIEEWLDEFQKAYQHASTLATGGGDDCQKWKAISYFADKVIDKIPDF